MPSAYKLRDLEVEYEKSRGRRPTEAELAELASLGRGEVRRLKKLLSLPAEDQNELMAELEKPRHQQRITVDHVLEAQKGAASLQRRGIIDSTEENELRKAILGKFRDRVLTNTVAPRQLARIGRAVEREELSQRSAHSAVRRLIDEPGYTIDSAFRDSAAQYDFQHGLEQLVGRVISQLLEHGGRGYELSTDLRERLGELRRVVDRLLKA